MRTTSSRDNWERLVAAVIKREQIWQLCHQDSITTIDSDFTQRDLSLRSVPSSSSRLRLATYSVVQEMMSFRDVSTKNRWALINDLPRLANDDDAMLLDWVKTCFEENKFEIIVDQDLEGNFVEEEVEKLFQIALICTQTDPEGRPTMSEIVRMLEYGDGLDEGWEKFKNVYQDENYSSKFHPSAEWIMTNDLGKELVGIPEDHFGLKSFSLRELQLATDNFYHQNFLGCGGGFGNVYKGRLADGSLVAVKRYKELAEVKIEEDLEILSIVKHRNVIGPLGLCITEKEWLIVYPYMANGSVASCLRERRESQPPLGWETRLRIALGVARALDYLHHGCIMGIIHRDVKAANILLDEDFEAVVSDFSLAKFMDNIDDVVRGTCGHIAPEYLSTGKCSLETDVYGYGIFLLELITAERAFDLPQLANDDDVMLLDWVKTCFEENKFEIIVDQDLEGNFVEEEVEKLFQIALICTQTDPEGRPTMSEIVRMLEYGDGLDEGWEKFKNVYQDENYSSKLHPSAEWIMTNSSLSFNAEELFRPR